MTNTQPDSGNWWDPNSSLFLFNPNGPANPFSPDNLANPLNPKSPVSAGPIGDLVKQANPLGSINAFFAVLGRPDFWIRAGIVTAGVGLVIVGIIVLVSSNKTVGAALTAAGKAAKLTPVGAATSVAAEAIS